MQERYHEYILRRTREENMTEEWERSFLPLDDPRAVPPPKCDHCGDNYLEFVEKTKTIFVLQDKVTFRYCSQACLEEHHMKRLRRFDGKV